MAETGSTETTREMSQDGADITAAATLTGGWGIRGWLSALFTKLLNTIDPVSSALRTLLAEHYQIHNGSHFFSRDFIDLGNGATHNILVVTPDTTKWSHFIFAIEHELEAFVTFTEGVATGGDGTPVTAFNNNRNSVEVSTTLLFHTPTSPTGGDVLARDRKGSGKKFGGGGRSEEEIVLKQNTKYLVSITNGTASNNLINWEFSFYENISGV